jgi:hypothetical protein
MAQKAGFLRDLKMLFFVIVLVAGSAIDLLALDLVLLLQMGLVDVFHFLGKFDFFGFKFILRVAVAVGRHAIGIGDPRLLLDCLAAKWNVGETFRPRLGNVFSFSRGAGRRRLSRFLGRPGRVVAIDAAEFFVFQLS